MRKSKSALILSLAGTLTVSGCATRIIDADFNQLGGSVGPVTGEIPGKPVGDYIVLNGNGGEQFAKIAGDKLLLRQEGAGSPSGAPLTGQLYLISVSAQDEDARRTFFWTGKVTSSSAFSAPPLAIDISAQERRTQIDPWPDRHIRLLLGRETATLKDFDGNTLASAPANLDLHEEHEVFMALRLDQGTCKITIKQATQAEVLLTATLPTQTVNLLRDARRTVMRLWFPGYREATVYGAYAMDDILVRAR